MVEDDAATPARTPKYASFSPKKKEEETKVGTVDVSFVDPLSQKVSYKEVYLDPETWSKRANTMRFLISADLVNLVTESQMMRHKRFRKAKKVMEETRLAFLVDLWKLRGLVGRVRRAAEVEEEIAAIPDEPCPVRFFVPEMYFDDHTLECITKASAGFSGHLLEEIRLLQERLDLLGGKNWRNLLAYALKYMQTTEIGEIVVDAFPDVSTRRTVENAITRGLWDQIDELQPVVEDLEAEMMRMHLLEEADARVEAVQEDIARKLAAISSFNERHVTAVTKLQEPDPEIPPDSESEIEEEDDEDEEESESEGESAASSVTDAWDEEEEIKRFIAAQGQAPSKAELKKLRKGFSQDKKIAKLKSQKESRQQDMEGQKRARIKSLLARWEKTATQAKEEVKELEQPLQRAEHKSNQEMDEEFLSEMEAAKAMEAEAEQLAMEAEQATEKAQQLTQEVRQEEATAQQAKEVVQELVQEKQSLPPPDPRTGRLRELGEEQVELMKKSKVCQEKISKIKGRIRLVKMELRELYRMLGWFWEESSSDDEGDKPYWLRKRIAQKTATQKKPFNEHHFLNQEDKVMARRIQRMASEQKLKDTSTIVSQLQAARRTCRDLAEGTGRAGTAGASGVAPAAAPLAASSVLPFKRPEGFEGRFLETLETLETSKLRRQKARNEEARNEEGPKEARKERGERGERGNGAELELRSLSLGNQGKLRQLREILESQLRSCAECFRALLEEGRSPSPSSRSSSLFPSQAREPTTREPTRGDRGEREREGVERALIGSPPSPLELQLRPRLDRLLSQIESPQELEVGHQAEVLEDSLAALQGLIGEAVGYGFSELRESLDMGELRRRLSDIRQSQRQLQQELRRLTQPRRSGSAMSSAFETEFLLSSSRMSSHSMLSLNEAPPSQDGDSSLGFKEPVVGSSGKLHERRKTGQSTRQGRPEAVDFGFRPDGAGEESVESWPLFKVSKASQEGAAASDASAGGPLSSSRPGRLRPPGDRARAQESKMSRLQNVAMYCDFSDYMSQLQQSGKDLWHSASSPELGKKGPSLPELVKTKGPEELSMAIASSTGKGRWKTSCYGGRRKAPPDAAWAATAW